MIGSLAGVIAARSPPSLLLEVAGVGYELEAPMSTFYTLPAVGESARLLVHMVVREDAQLLYGFGSAASGCTTWFSRFSLLALGSRISSISPCCLANSAVM